MIFLFFPHLRFSAGSRLEEGESRYTNENLKSIQENRERASNEYQKIDFSVYILNNTLHVCFVNDINVRMSQEYKTNM